jgi:protein-S-isoprenylcysteine O-methyltransferase Ste14
MPPNTQAVGRLAITVNPMRCVTINQLFVQIILASVSWLGIPIGWLPGYRGQRRIKQPIAAIITNLGPLIMIVPWIIMPLMSQPRILGSFRTFAIIIGTVLLVLATLVEIWATPYISPAAKKGGDELDPEFLVVKGPYKWVRHSQYLGGVLALFGWVLLQGGLYSILLSPVFYLLFRYEAYLEESRVLEPKFGDEFRKFKKQVPTGILGRIGTIILILVYLIFIALVLLGRVIIIR